MNYGKILEFSAPNKVWLISLINIPSISVVYFYLFKSCGWEGNFIYTLYNKKGARNFHSCHTTYTLRYCSRVVYCTPRCEINQSPSPPPHRLMTHLWSMTVIILLAGRTLRSYRGLVGTVAVCIWVGHRQPLKDLHLHEYQVCTTSPTLVLMLIMCSNHRLCDYLDR